MIKVLSHREVSLSSLKLPGDLREVIQDDSIQGMGASIQELIQINPIVMRKSDGLLICGRRRAAACIRMGLNKVWVRFVECTDEEAAGMTAAENLYRSHDTNRDAKDSALLVELLSRKMKEDDPKPPTWPDGRPTTREALARKIVAQQSGLKEETVRHYEWRRRKANGEPPRKRGRPPKAEKKIELETLGIEPDEAWYSKVVEVAAHLQTASNLVRNARRALDKIETPLPRISQQALVRAADDLLASLKSLRPSTVCPWCKSIEQVTEECDGCNAAGWLGKGQTEGVPKELLDPEDVMVVYQGETTPAWEVLEMFSPEPKGEPGGETQEEEVSGELTVEEAFS